MSRDRGLRARTTRRQRHPARQSGRLLTLCAACAYYVGYCGNFPLVILRSCRDNEFKRVRLQVQSDQSLKLYIKMEQNHGNAYQRLPTHSIDNA